MRDNRSPHTHHKSSLPTRLLSFEVHVVRIKRERGRTTQRITRLAWPAGVTSWKPARRNVDGEPMYV